MDGDGERDEFLTEFIEFSEELGKREYSSGLNRLYVGFCVSLIVLLINADSWSRGILCALPAFFILIEIIQIKIIAGKHKTLMEAYQKYKTKIYGTSCIRPVD